MLLDLREAALLLTADLIALLAQLRSAHLLLATSTASGEREDRERRNEWQ
jgi:hypothetical protein